MSKCEIPFGNLADLRSVANENGSLKKEVSARKGSQVTC